MNSYLFVRARVAVLEDGLSLQVVSKDVKRSQGMRATLSQPHLLLPIIEEDPLLPHYLKLSRLRLPPESQLMVTHFKDLRHQQPFVLLSEVVCRPSDRLNPEPILLPIAAKSCEDLFSFSIDHFFFDFFGELGKCGDGTRFEFTPPIFVKGELYFTNCSGECPQDVNWDSIALGGNFDHELGKVLKFGDEVVVNLFDVEEDVANCLVLLPFVELLERVVHALGVVD